MKKLFALLALTFLTSCIDVDDMGEIWGKAVMDPALAGTWKMNASKDTWKFVKMGNAYRIDKLVTSDKPEDDDSPLARTLKVDKMTFILLKDQTAKNGTLVRYEVDGDTVKQYGFPQLEPVISWIATNYPQVQSIRMTGGQMLGPSLKILTLDDSALAIISKVPDNFWNVEATYTRQKN